MESSQSEASSRSDDSVIVLDDDAQPPQKRPRHGRQVSDVWTESGETEVITWWEGHKEFKNLREVALLLFCLTPANSACERNFSNYSFIHSKLRNRLGNDKAKESVYIFANAKEIKGEDDEASDEWEYVEESDREVRPRSKNRHTQY